MGQGPEKIENGGDYLSYLLRLWQESGDKAAERCDTPKWRASLTSPITGERVGFASLEGLVAYLQEQMRTGPDFEGIQDQSKIGSERRRWSTNT